MLIDAIDIKRERNDIKKMLSDKTPLMSKVIQLNTRIKGTNLQYIEYKVITYDVNIRTKEKSIIIKNIFRLFWC
mgnify:CR=1 FL=1